MKTPSFAIIILAAILLTGCAGSPLPPTDHQVQKPSETTVAAIDERS